MSENTTSRVGVFIHFYLYFSQANGMILGRVMSLHHVGLFWNIHTVIHRNVQYLKIPSKLSTVPVANENYQMLAF